MADDPIATEQPKAETSSPEVLVREGETALADFANGLIEEATRGRREQAHEDDWKDWEDHFWGQMWPDNLPTFKPPIVENELQSLILTEVSDLSDARPTVFIQKNPQHPERDEAVERAFHATWQRHAVDQVIMQGSLHGMVFPLGFFTCLWNPTALQGLGDLVIQAKHPRQVLPDPDAMDDDRWRYVTIQDAMDLLDIRKMWPDQGWRVKPEAGYSLKLDQRAGTQQRSGWYQGPMYSQGGSQVAEGYAKARAVVNSIFIYDDALEEEIQETKDETGNVLSLSLVRRSKYPNGRLIQMANNVVLYDGPNPYWGRFPVVRVPMFPTLDTFWPPVSPFGSVLELQKAANKVESLKVENVLRLNAGLLIADADSGVDPNTFMNIPGQCILKKPGSDVHVQYPPPMPQDMVMMPEQLRYTMKLILGFPPSRVGMGARGNVSAELNETEISQSMSLSRLRGRLLHHSVQKLAEMILARMAQFYTTARGLAYVAPGGKWESVPWRPLDEPQGYSVHVDPASFTVRSKSMMQRLYLQLAKAGKIGTPDLLKMLEIPNAEEVGERMMKELALQAQAKENKKK